MNNYPVDAIEVKVASHYLPAESEPKASRYTFAYTVTITNQGQRAARLMTRHWIIVDSSGKKQEVQGDGVVGEQPYLKPGESFQYTSGTIIETPAGTMEGKYHLVTDSGEHFAAEIPPFALAVPQMLH